MRDYTRVYIDGAWVKRSTKITPPTRSGVFAEAGKRGFGAGSGSMVSQRKFPALHRARVGPAPILSERSPHPRAENQAVRKNQGVRYRFGC